MNSSETMPCTSEFAAKLEKNYTPKEEVIVKDQKQENTRTMKEIIAEEEMYRGSLLNFIDDDESFSNAKTEVKVKINVVTYPNTFSLSASYDSKLVDWIKCLKPHHKLFWDHEKQLWFIPNACYDGKNCFFFIFKFLCNSIK